MTRITKRTCTLLLTVVIFALSLYPSGAQAEDTVRIAYVEWSSSIASAHMVQAVLQEELGVKVELLRMDARSMWQAVADGHADAMFSAWLPTTHEHYLEEFGKQLTDLGPNLEGARIGLVVPDVSVGRQTGNFGVRARSNIKAESIPGLKDYGREFRHRIIGIDPEAGIMSRTEEAIDAYGLDNYRLIDGSEVSMTAELSNAIRHQRWIVVTGWSPHWMFARWKLKFLEDPKSVYGGSENIHTMVRKGLDSDMPEVYRVLDRFSWTTEEASQFMIWNQTDEGLFPYEKGLRWMRMNPDRVADWLR